MKRHLLFFVAFAVVSFPAFAQETATSAPVVAKEATPKPEKKKKHKRFKVKLKGLYHGNLNMNLSDDGNDVNETAFQTTRMYITAKASLDDMFSFRTTLDFGHYGFATMDGTGVEAGKSPLLGYIKYAYFQFKPMKTLKIRFGQQSTPWIGTMDKVMGYRYVYKSGLDYYKLNSSADTGLSVLGKVMGGMINYHVGIYNGAGYKAEYEGENLQNMSIAARVSAFPMKSMKDSPLAKLGVHLYFNTDAAGDGDDSIRGMMYGGALSFNHKYIDLLVEFMMTSSDADGDEGGMLIAPSVKFKYQKYALFASYGMFSDGNEDEDWTRLIVGATYDHCKKFAVSLNYQMITSKGHTKESDLSGIFVNTKFKF